MDDNDRLPLTRSLEAEVRAAFAVPSRSDGLSRQALLSALDGLKSGDKTLTDALRDAGFMPPSADDQPVLDWIDNVFGYWAEHYPLAPELEQVIHRSRSLAAAFAVKDTRFFIPGGHAMHRLLDVIHNGLIGWHSGLGGAAGTALEGAREALERARRDFPSEPQVDETLELLSQKTQAHEAQLKRLDSALLQREAATMGDDLPRLRTAIALNEILAEHQVPGSVARFIKSDWFESGVILAARNGGQGQEWSNFVTTTQILVQAVQPIEPGDAQGHERLQATMHQLPSTLSRQLLSLQPDHDAITGAIGLIEYALLRNVRGEDLGLLLAEPLEVPGLPEGGAPTPGDLVELGIRPGGWYAVDTADGELRLRLVGGLADNIFLLFMDFLGARAVRKSYLEFKSLLASGEARSLNTSDSFCRAMVEATEVRERERTAQRAREAELAAEQEAEARRKQDAMAATPSGGRSQAGEAQPQGAQPNQSQGTPQDARQNNTQNASQHHSEHASQGFSQHSAQDLSQHSSESSSQHSGDYQSDENYQASGSPQQEPHAQANSSLTTTQQRDDASAMPTTEAPYESNTVVKLQIPMGTWMGFHDREPPLMARVAVRDLEKDSYIFTNREGIKLRELTVAQLIALIDRDMVDILERKTNFRETVNQMRQDQERISNT